MVFQCFSWDFLLGIYDEKYVPFFWFDHVPIEWLEMVDGWSRLLLVILVWLISTRKWVITQVASRPSRVTRPYLTHLGWNRFLQPQLLKSGNQVKRHWTFISIITSCQKLPKYENQHQISGHWIFWGHFSIFLLAILQAPTIPPQSTALMQGRHGSEGEVSRFFVKGANPRASRKGLGTHTGRTAGVAKEASFQLLFFPTHIL